MYRAQSGMGEGSGGAWEGGWLEKLTWPQGRRKGGGEWG